jgi:hypothetical protein
MSKRTSRWLIGAVAAGALGVVAPAALAETVTVKFPNARLLTKKSGGSDLVMALRRGDTLEVVGREGTWLKVKAADGKEGYVQENSLAKPGETVSQGTSGAVGRGASFAEASRGVGESEQWAKSTGNDTRGLMRMFALRETVKGADFDVFTTQGNVGPAKK